MLINENHLAELNSPIQTIHARVELHNGSTLVQICTCQDFLSDFTIERVGEGKFFGFGICHKLLVKFIDIERELNLTNIDFIEVTFGVNGEFIYPFPTFYISEVNRDETTNEISVVAYDKLYQLGNYRVSDLELPASYTMSYFASACASLIGIPLTFQNVTDFSVLQLNYPEGANLDGTETIRDVLNALAEATQTVYYIDGDWRLTFKRLSQEGEPVITIGKEQYMGLDSGANCTLGAICHATELGDNITATSPIGGVTQYLRDNPFLELRDDAGEILDKGIAAAGGLTINPFYCDWVGNYLLEIGDKISIIAEDDSEIITYILDDSIAFDGTLSETSRWEFDNNDAETAENPTSLGDALKQTYARVDKANREISLVASETSANSSDISALKINTESISSSVQTLRNETESALGETGEKISTVTKEFSEFKQTSNQALLSFQKEITENGVTKVDTRTGFTFDEEGLRINKDNSGIENLIDNTGMYVKQDGAEVLSANTNGVKAKDLHAVTYLWIGSHSRFEDYESGRTGCFWIGG